MDNKRNDFFARRPIKMAKVERKLKEYESNSYGVKCEMFYFCTRRREIEIKSRQIFYRIATKRKILLHSHINFYYFMFLFRFPSHTPYAVKLGSKQKTKEQKLDFLHSAFAYAFRKVLSTQLQWNAAA